MVSGINGGLGMYPPRIRGTPLLYHFCYIWNQFELEKRGTIEIQAQESYYNGTCSRGERWGSTLNTRGKVGIYLKEQCEVSEDGGRVQDRPT